MRGGEGVAGAGCTDAGAGTGGVSGAGAGGGTGGAGSGRVAALSGRTGRSRSGRRLGRLSSSGPRIVTLIEPQSARASLDPPPPGCANSRIRIACASIDSATKRAIEGLRS